MTEVKILPIMNDNYVFLIQIEKTKEVIIVDPGQAHPIQSYFSQEASHLKPSAILLTHHHPDHIGGAKELQQEYQIPVYAPLKNKSQIPFADHWVQEGLHLEISGEKFEVWELPGHTLGHVGYFHSEKRWMFSGDVLFGLGCGRVFEGTMEQMHQTLQRFHRLPAHTLIYCSHEYTETNYAFCRRLSLEDEAPIAGDNETLLIYGNELKNKRALGLPSVPLKLDVEKETNPFLLSQNAAQFTRVRQLRNHF